MVEHLSVRDSIWGPYGTLVKEQGCSELILGYGAQRARL